MTKFETVNTHQLKNGDVVIHHGAMFTLKDRVDHGVTGGHTEEYNGSCITFRTETHGEYDPAVIAMPQHWWSDWTIQGNKLATWCRVVA